MQREGASISKRLIQIQNNSNRLIGSHFSFLFYLFKRQVYLTHMLQMYLIPTSRQSETSIGDSTLFRNPQGSGGVVRYPPSPSYTTNQTWQITKQKNKQWPLVWELPPLLGTPPSSSVNPPHASACFILIKHTLLEVPLTLEPHKQPLQQDKTNTWVLYKHECIWPFLSVSLFYQLLFLSFLAISWFWF